MFTARFSHSLLLSTLTTLLLGSVAAYAVEEDLNVLFIERTPKYDYDAAKNMPEPGDVVVWHGHIRYWGDANSTPLSSVDYHWKIDGQVVQSGTITDWEPMKPPFDFDYTGYPAPTDPQWLKNPNYWPKNPHGYDPDFPPTGWRKVTLTWTWQPGRHTVELVVDPNNDIFEKTEQNNSIEDYTDAILASFWVEESVWRYFHLHQENLGIGANSWEDWIQRHMKTQNQLYEEAIWDISPNGVVTRVRIDRIIVVPDGMLPVNGGLPGNNPDSSDKTIDLQWGFQEGLLPPHTDFYGDTYSVDENNAFYFEKSLIHELGHARYLIDCYGFDVHNTAHHGGADAVQIWEGDTYVGGSHYMPFVNFEEVLYYNKSGGIMTGPYGFVWSPYEAGALNLIGNDRATCGNMNSPCNIGVYLQDLPQNNHVQFTDGFGDPRAGASIELYRADPASGWYGKLFDDIPDDSYTTDPNGYIHLPRNPFNPGGDIVHTWGHANGLLIIRIQDGDDIFYRFWEVVECNMEYWKGNTQNAYYTIQAWNDTDSDNLPDEWELANFESLAQTGNGDFDSDGLNNRKEWERRTDPDDPDTDADGLLDGDEVDVGSDPLNDDTDGDTVLDGADNCVLTPNVDQTDGDGDGLGDSCDPLTDCNGNGLPDADDIAFGSSADCNTNGIPDECDVTLNSIAVADNEDARYGWIEIAGTGTPLNLADNGFVTITSPFVNQLFPTDSIRVSNNGALGFVAGGGLSSFNAEIPNAYAFGGAQVLFPFWDDLDSDTGNVYWEVTGSTPDRVLIVEYKDRPHRVGDAILDGDECTFQVQLFESPIDNVWAQFLYQDTNFLKTSYDDGASASIGYQTDGTFGIEYSYNTPSVTGGSPYGTVLSVRALPAKSPDANGNGIPDECESVAVCPGDSNCDGVVNWRDIDYFVAAQGDNVAGWEALFGGAPTCDFANNDANDDGTVNWRDIDPFVALQGNVCD